MRDTITATAALQVPGVLARILDWWKNDSADYRYLATATDLAELERRSRLLESESNGAIWVTFNH